nr:reverse transcriptase domain-containing protein [Tanacetum cinerariifolium]
MTPATTPLLEFSGEISWSLGHKSLMVSLGDREHSKNALMNFMVVRSPSPYNDIIDRLGLKKIQAVPSTAHGMLKFPVKGGTVTLHSNIIILAKRKMVAEALNESLPNEITVTKGIKPAYMTGVPRSIAKHLLNICEGCPPIR